MHNTPDIERLFNTMLQLGKLVSQQAQESHMQRTATMLQFSALHFLKEQPNVTVSDLAQFLQLSRSSATQLIERLVKSGFVQRVNDKKDRRITRLVITKLGEKEFIMLKGKLMKKMQKVFSKIPEKDIKELIRIHTNLVETLKKEQP